MNDKLQMAELHSALRTSFAKGWQELLIHDSSEPDLDQLTGRHSTVDPTPVALEISSFLAESTAEEYRPVSPKYNRDNEIGYIAKLQLDLRSATGERGRTLALAGVLAASLLITIGTLNWAWQRESKLLTLHQELEKVRDQVSDITSLQTRLESSEQRISETGKQLVIAEKEQLALLSSGSQQVYLVGLWSDELLRQAVSKPGAHRTTKDISNTEAKVIDKAVKRLTSTIDQLLSPEQRAVEHLAVQLQAGKLEAADQYMQTIDASQAQGSVRAKLTNARACLLTARAQRLSRAEARPLHAEAEKLFRTAGETGLAEAWLNLALLFAAENETAQAQSAAIRFCESETEPARIALVKDAFSLN
ncbi:hypothetical protein ETAA8_45510 [Anatilimnocola aggregata]|uniref:Uncharacterized protein n=1 Tax=Anatilimnocola aggregata TaxID=2528021 RepID=A0A517YGX9_9BACT|nr:hypothetical protein [Anatilimnocola aggregata]QDU29441.1 hypothetical protein ETAA8_45510 [Anatilimnocola aggregata]